MKKIIILAIALLSTGIVFSETVFKKDASAKTAAVKVVKSVDGNIANDSVASGD